MQFWQILVRHEHAPASVHEFDWSGGGDGGFFDDEVFESVRPFFVHDVDEEILVLFASQVAAAIANARTYRDERRARSS